ncbi:hypothetical protein BDQ17DRAFT_1359361 [Cyathus striatus]|nr:hypothetical protein BDQ17DRAFT_1359361 [Cyathus striatus]
MASLYYPTLRLFIKTRGQSVLTLLPDLAPRQILLITGLLVWTIRLGAYLTWRAIYYNGDIRFTKIKQSPSTFTIYWLAQAVWISVVGLPVYLCNILPLSTHPALGIRDYFSFALYSGCLFLEVAADWQKYHWKHLKNMKIHEDKFISSGLWSWSRHPNYVAEIGIWTSIWLLSIGSLKASSHPRLFIVLAVSGVPGLEKVANLRFGDDPKWIQYKSTVPIFWPWGKAQ